MSASSCAPPGQCPNQGISKLVLRREAVAELLHLAILLTPDADADVPDALHRPLAQWLREARDQRA
jgi:hypothetical protein